jgi:ubiquinone/menaquinone biosynthesis C-methylase UbiE
MENLEENSKKEFNNWAKTYDNFFNHLYFSFSNKKIANLINYGKKISILDVGSGTGILIEQLVSKNNLKIYGLDLSPEMVKISKEKFSKNKNVEITLGSAVKIPFKNKLFDYVTCSNSFHHHPNSLQSLKEMYRVLKPKGKVIILDAFKDDIFRKLYCKIIDIVEGKVLHYSKKEIKQLFKKAGFDNINQQNFGLLHLITIGEKK